MVQRYNTTLHQYGPDGNAWHDQQTIPDASPYRELKQCEASVHSRMQLQMRGQSLNALLYAVANNKEKDAPSTKATLDGVHKLCFVEFP